MLRGYSHFLIDIAGVMEREQERSVDKVVGAHAKGASEESLTP